MDYQLLKINGVTKLCDDRLLLDENKDILEEQWFDFQLHFICDILNIPKYDPILCPPIYTKDNPKPVNSNYTHIFTRNQIFRKLSDTYGVVMQKGFQIIEIPDKELFTTQDKDVLEKQLVDFGITTKKIYKLYNPIINKVNLTLIDPVSFLNKPVVGNKYYTTDINEYKRYISDTISEITTTSHQDNIGTELRDILKESSKKQIADDTAIADDTVIADDTSIKKTKLVRRKKKIKPFSKLGRLTWTRNSCYADSIIYLFFLRMVFTQNSNLEQQISKSTKLEDMNDKRCVKDGKVFGPALSLKENQEILEKIRITYIKIIELLKKGKNTTLEELRSLFGSCGGPDTSEWNTSGIQPTQTFTDDLIRLLQYKLPDDIPGMSSESRVGNYKRYYYSQNNVNIDSIKRNLKKYGESNFNLFNNAVGEKIYDTKTEYSDPDTVDFQTVYISAEDIIWKTIVKTEKQVLDEASVISLSNDKIYIDPYSKQTFLKRDEIAVKKLYKNTTIPMLSLLSPQRVTDTSQEDSRSYYITNSDYELDSNSDYYFKKDSPDDLYSVQSLPKEIGYKIAFKIEKSKLTSTSNDILIFVNRLTMNLDGTSSRVSIKINEIENITIEDGTQYKLHGIVYWKGGHFMSIFNHDDIYYHYDDMPANKASITKIGNYDKMIQWKDGNVIAAQENSAIYHYIKM